MDEHLENEIIHSTLSNSTPQSPVAAFERLKEIVKNGLTNFHADPETIIKLMRPFLINPSRDEPHMRTIIGAYQVALYSDLFKQAKIPFKTQIKWLFRKKFKKVVSRNIPEVLNHILELENVLKKDLRPGSVSLYVKPIQYLNTPTGFGPIGFHRYRITIQTFVDSAIDDELSAVAVEIKLTAKTAEIVIDEIYPQAGFITISMKETTNAQTGQQLSRSQKQVINGEVSGVGTKASINKEIIANHQQSTQIAIGDEQTTTRPKQYLIARKIGGKAVWKTLANIGPIDAASSDYMVEVLIPAEIREINIHIEARVEWLRAGLVPAIVQKTKVLPTQS